MARVVTIWFGFVFFSLAYSEIAISSVALIPKPTQLQLYNEALNKSGCKFTSTNALEITPVSKASLRHSGGDILFIRQKINESGPFEHMVHSIFFTSVCDDKAKKNRVVAEDDSYSSRLIFLFFQTILSIPAMSDHGRDFDFIWQLFRQFSGTEYLELFYSLPDVTVYPVVMYRSHQIEVPELVRHGGLWFPGLSGEELFPGYQRIMPLSAEVISILEEIVSAVNLKVAGQQRVPQLKCMNDSGTVCEFLPATQRDLPTVNQRTLMMQDRSVIIPLAGINNVSALHLDRSGQLALVSLQLMLEQLDFIRLYYLPCKEFSRRFDAMVNRRYSSTMNFARFMGMLNLLNPPAHQAPALADQMVQAGQGPGPDDYPMFSDEGYNPIFPGDIPSGWQTGRNDKTKKGGRKRNSGAGAGATQGQGADRQGAPVPPKQPKRVRFQDEDDDEKNPDKRRNEAEKDKESLREKLKNGYAKVRVATKELIKDMDQELGYLANSLKRKNVATASSIARERKKSLDKWVYVIKTEPNGKTSKVPMKKIKDTDVFDLDVELEAIEEEYVVEPETGAILADGRRRISVVAAQDIERIQSRQPSLDGVDEFGAQVFEEEHGFDSETPGLIALGRRRASSVADIHVNALRRRLDSLLEGEKDIREMSRAEIMAASDKIDQLFDDELTLRYEELDRLDQGRIRLSQEILRKKEALDNLHGTWFSGKNEDAVQLGEELKTLQLRAQEVGEKYAAMHAYDARYRHWAGSLLKTEFDQAAHERLRTLDNAQEKVLGSFKVAYFGRHWKKLASSEAAHPPLAFAKEEVPAEVLPEPELESFITTHGRAITVTLSSVFAAVGGYYFSDSIYAAYQWMMSEREVYEEEGD